MMIARSIASVGMGSREGIIVLINRENTSIMSEDDASFPIKYDQALINPKRGDNGAAYP